MLLQGLFVPLTCPFYRDGVSYVRKLEHNVTHYSLSPVAGLLALPPGGEAGALTDDEAIESLEAVGQTAGKHKVLIAGVEKNSVAAALALAEAAAAARFDAVLLATPRDWPRLVHGADASKLLLYFQAVADRSPLPVILWSDTRPPALPLPVASVAELATHNNIFGLIDAALTSDRLVHLLAATASVRREVTVTTVFEAVTRRMLEPEIAAAAGSGFVSLDALTAGGGTATALAAPAVAATPSLKTRIKTVGFQVLSAAPATQAVPLLKAGAAGILPTLASAAPQACFEAYVAWKDGDEHLATERAARLERIEALLAELGPAAVKAGCDFNGYFGGQPRLPRLPLRADDRTRVETALALIRN